MTAFASRVPANMALSKEQQIVRAKNLVSQAKALLASRKPNLTLLESNLVGLEEYVKKSHYFTEDFNTELLDLTLQVGELIEDLRDAKDQAYQKRLVAEAALADKQAAVVAQQSTVSDTRNDRLTQKKFPTTVGKNDIDKFSGDTADCAVSIRKWK